jgi:hypothetical protein
MAADLPESYERRMDAFQFIKDVAVDWDDSRYLEAEPGDYVTVARRAKNTANWFVGAITDENARTAIIPFNYLLKKKHGMLPQFTKTQPSAWKENPMAYKIRKVLVNSKSVLKQKLAAGGGVAISLKKAEKKEMKGLKKI